MKQIRFFLITVALLMSAFRLGAQETLTPIFSHPGGWQSDPVNLEITCAEAGAAIYYTLDGSLPKFAIEAGSGKLIAIPDTFGVQATLYTEPLLISMTTPVSAVCVSETGVTGALVSQTYLFLDDILHQPDSIDGYPDGWSYSGPDTARVYYPADYGMDSDVCFAPEYKDLMDSAFMSIGSMCVVTSPGHLFSHDKDSVTGGIYIHTGKSTGSLGDGWERPVSLEFYDPQRDKSFQINCGMQLHGGNSRNPGNSPKHSFRVSFRSKYGESKLRYKMFPGTDAVKKFDHLVFRAGYNYTWIVNGSLKQYSSKIKQREQAQYIIDTFGKELQMAMGHPGVHHRFVHLFLNGIYWGLYDVSEKINNDFAQAYLGGKDEDYDVVGDHNETIDGTRDVYNNMFATVKKVSSTLGDKNYKRLTDSAWLDIDNYIDYMLLNWYIGNDDWDKNNWRCARSRVAPGTGFHYFVWDAETALTDVGYSKVSRVDGDPSTMMQYLRKNPDFVLKVADHVQSRFFHDGVLTSAAASELYSRLASEIDVPIIAESARWGDYRRDVTGEATDVYTRNDFWYPRWQALLKDYFPERSLWVFDELKDYGLYPDVDAPWFSLPGGCYDGDSLQLTIRIEDILGEDSHEAGDVVYCTLDGTDPRVEYAGKVSSAAVKKAAGESVSLYRTAVADTTSITVKARTRRGTKWSALAEAHYDLISKLTGLEQASLVQPEVWVNDGHLCVLIHSTDCVVLDVLSLDGRLVFRTGGAYLPADGVTRYDMSNLASGIYIYKVACGSQSFTGKVIF